jgi:sigma54-dependent transcription regulator
MIGARDRMYVKKRASIPNDRQVGSWIWPTTGIAKKYLARQTQEIGMARHGYSGAEREAERIWVFVHD